MKDFGFEIGDYISVTCEHGRLVITQDEEKAAMEKAEKEFMEKEMKILCERFEEEKKKIHARFVAEHVLKFEA